MSSDHSESVDQSNDSKGDLNESPSPKKLHRDDTNEHAKPKRRGRRGKKRKQRKESGGAAPCRGEHLNECKHDPSECEKHSLSWDSDEDDLETEDFPNFSDVIIRPINVPKAPENSTQFIIDDHNECQLYMSFETPNPYLADYFRGEEDDSEIVEPIGEDAAYEDINYIYESPHDFDNSAYYDREFEQIYKSNRFEELMRMHQNDLISGLQNLENRLRDLNDELIREDPNPILEKLQSELLELQEKNVHLRRENGSLTADLEESGIEDVAFAKDDIGLHAEEVSDVYLEQSVNASYHRDSSDSVYVEETGEDVHLEESYPSYIEGEVGPSKCTNSPVSNHAVHIKETDGISDVNMDSKTETIRQISNNMSFPPVDAERSRNSLEINSPTSPDCVNTNGKYYSKDDFEEKVEISELPNHKESSTIGTFNERIPSNDKNLKMRDSACQTKCCDDVTLGPVSEEHEQMNAVVV